MTCTEVASFLRVHLSSVRRWSRTGELKAYKVGSRGDWRYREQDVMAFLYGRQGLDENVVPAVGISGNKVGRGAVERQVGAVR